MLSLLENRIPPPVVALLLAAGMWWLAREWPGAGWPAWGLGGWRLALAGALVLVGGAFDVAGLMAFRASRTTVNPLRPERSSALVTGGVYRLTRNPMYVGMACLLLAWAVYLGSAWALSGPVLFVFYITRFQIQPEERALRRLFGPAYEAYAARVRRWL